MEDNNLNKIESEWDQYWLRSSKKKSINKIYDFFAYIYRNFLIGPSFKYYMYKHFNKNSDILHAGCGGGEVDKFIVKNFNITAVDISSRALDLYNKINPNVIVKKSNIFNMNLDKKKFDGIYNLGVIEHFNAKKFLELMIHFKEHLNKNGKIILFWPPKYGLSVIALHIIHFIINKIFKMKLKLHPDEPFKYTNRKQVEKILQPIGLKITDTYFNFRDAFTYKIIVIKLI